jgi:hypothetical protein
MQSIFLNYFSST